MSADNHVTKAQLHEFIQTCNLIGFKELLDRVQMQIMKFDDPSLLMMAIEMYLNPICMLRQHQKEIIIALIKIGLRLWVPKGTILLYLMNKCKLFDTSIESTQTAEQTEEKLIEICDLLLEYKMTSILYEKYEKLPIAIAASYHKFRYYFMRHQRAMRIQRTWKKYSKLKLNRVTA